jgi:hypothetical protein
MNRARDLACRTVRAALGLKRAGLAVVLAREVDHRAFFGHSIAWLGERAMIFLQLFATRANIAVALWIEGEVAARKGAVRALGLVHQFHVRLDSTLWSKRSEEGRDYLSLKLDDPSFNAPIYANLFRDEDGDGYTLIWSWPRKNGD